MSNALRHTIANTKKYTITFPLRGKGGEVAARLRFGSVMDAQLAKEGKAVPHTRRVDDKTLEALKRNKGFRSRLADGILTLSSAA